MSKVNIDFLQEKKIRMLFGMVAFIGGLTTVLIYIQSRRNKKEKDEILALEKELRQLQIEKLRAEKKKEVF
jgi:cadmium resistance protein CadD (predicted permease)